MSGRRDKGRRARRTPRAEPRRRTSGAVRAAVRRAEHGIEILLPERRVQPDSVVAHLGPTNSGKTHDALAFLKEQGRGVSSEGGLQPPVGAPPTVLLVCQVC